MILKKITLQINHLLPFKECTQYLLHFPDSTYITKRPACDYITNIHCYIKQFQTAPCLVAVSRRLTVEIPKIKSYA